jgi:predicted PurR-regulated permease PerM
VDRSPWSRALIILGVVAIGLYLAGELWRLAQHFGDVIVLFFLAWLLAFALLPTVRFVESRLRVRRAAAAIVVYLGLLVVLFTCLILVIPLLIEQVSQLAGQLPALADRIPVLTHDIQSWLDRRGVALTVASTGPQPAFSQQATQLGATLVELSVVVASRIAAGLVSFTFVLVLSFYVALDGDRFVNAILTGLPENYRADAILFLVSIDRSFGGFLRGSAVQAVILGLGTAIIMSVTGLSYILLVSIFAGIVMVVPFIGPFLALVLPILIAVFSNLPLSQLLDLFLALAILQFLVLNFVAPRVMSQNVGLHPLLVVLALLVGVKEAGIAGAVFGVPVAAVIYAAVRIVFSRWSMIELQVPGSEIPGTSAEAFPSPAATPTHFVRFERFGPHLGRAISRLFHVWSN